MATWTFEVYYDTAGVPAWTDTGANNVAFAGSGGYDDTVEVAAWQDGTHVVDGTPGSDICTNPHAPNVKYVDATHFDSGGGSEVISDANLAATECTARWHFSHGSAISMQNCEIFAYDGTVEANPAPGVEIQIFERGVAAAAWTELNDASAPVGGSGSAFALADQAGAATDHYFYLALSWSPESVGAKTGAKLKIEGEYY